MLIACGKIVGGENIADFYGYRNKEVKNKKMFGRKIDLGSESQTGDRFGMKKRTIFVPEEVCRDFSPGKFVAFEVYTADVQVYNSNRGWERHIPIARSIVKLEELN